MELRPEIGDPVVLRDHADREYRTRVEHVGEGLLVVARPTDLPAEDEFGAGTELVVAWTDTHGRVTVLPTRILAAHAEGTLQLWSLAVIGPAFTEQKRRFVRAPASGPVVLWPAENAGTGTVTGSLLDVSEAAIRCTVGAGAADGFLAGHPVVVAEFRFGDVDFAIPGRAEFLRPTAHPAALEELVVVFDDPVADADALHEQVLAHGGAPRERDEGVG